MPETSSESDLEGSAVFGMIPLPLKSSKKRKGKETTGAHQKRKEGESEEYKRRRVENTGGKSNHQDTTEECSMDEDINEDCSMDDDINEECSMDEAINEGLNVEEDITGECSVAQDTSGEGSVEASTYKKPYRYCVFCKKKFSKLRNHIANKHHDNERVKEALQLPKKERDAAFDQMRKDGIFEFNKYEAKKNPDNPHLQRERKRKDETNSILVMCSICQSFIEKKYRKRHEMLHQKSDDGVSVQSVPANILSWDFEIRGSEYTKEVLSKFRTDEIGMQCVKDRVLVQVGQMMYHRVKSRENKKDEVRRNIMTDMRRLVAIHREMERTEKTMGNLPTKQGNISDIFRRSNFNHLLQAISNYTTSDTQLKAGLKIAIYYLLKSTSRILAGIHLINGDDKEAEEINRFVAVLEMHQNLSFGDATYQQSQVREQKLRRPKEHPLEEDLQAIKQYTCQRIEDLMSRDVNKREYTELRDLLVCRLTLYNARRGGEPSRLCVREWEEADAGAWLDQRHVKKLDPVDKALSKTLKVGYESGKGRSRLVPVLFPQDTHEPLRKLASEEVRNRCGVSNTNKFLFPTMSGAGSHVSGWYAVQKISGKLDLKNRKSITATRNRHRVSTEFALMDVPRSDREYIYQHLGHTEQVNQHVYQAPLAIRAITVVGKRLQTLDSNKGKFIVSPPSTSTTLSFNLPYTSSVIVHPVKRGINRRVSGI